MRKFLLSIVLVSFSIFSVSAQELNATVVVDAQQTSQPDLQVFRTLQTQLTDFLNTTQWTNQEYLIQERISCNFSIIVTDYNSNSFTASLQVQASRPAFNSTYSTPIYNFNDRQFNFSYTEFQPLAFNINSFDSNLISVLAYHIYTLIGLDADSFQLEGGMPYFELVKQIVNTAASSNSAGWKATDGPQSRFRFNDDMLSNVYSEFHSAMYKYHREGIDLMQEDQKLAKQNIIDALALLKGINDRRPNSFLLRTFFDAKSDEIEAIFSGGPSVDIKDLVANLNRMAPTRRTNWQNIKY